MEYSNKTGTGFGPSTPCSEWIWDNRGYILVQRANRHERYDGI